jgi:hypothetical protein
MIVNLINNNCLLWNRSGPINHLQTIVEAIELATHQTKKKVIVFKRKLEPEFHLRNMMWIMMLLIYGSEETPCVY